jgi:hypothetical protein
MESGRSGKKVKSVKNRYVKDENPTLRKVVTALKKLVKHVVSGTKETVNAWGVPTFVGKTPFAFYMVGKKHVTFGFPFATSLPDAEGLLEGTGKNMRHVKLHGIDDLETKGLRELIVASAEFEGGAPMPGMGRKRSMAGGER